MLGSVRGCPPRLRVLGAIGAAGISSGHIVFNSALTHPQGFHSVMYAISEFKRTGEYPSLSSMNYQAVETFAS